MSNIIQTDASKTGSGAVCQGTTTWESLFILEKDKTYECTGARCRETYNINLYHRKIGKNNPLTYRHMRPLPCLVKTGGTRSQGNMGLSVSQSNSSYTRVLTKQSDYWCRLAIQKSQGFKWLEIEPEIIFSDCETQKYTPNRAICFLHEPSVTKTHVLASWPKQLSSRFPSALLEKPLWVCVPSILLNKKGTHKIYISAD